MMAMGIAPGLQQPLGVTSASATLDLNRAQLVPTPGAHGSFPTGGVAWNGVPNAGVAWNGASEWPGMFGELELQNTTSFFSLPEEKQNLYDVRYWSNPNPGVLQAVPPFASPAMHTTHAPPAAAATVATGGIDTIGINRLERIVYINLAHRTDRNIRLLSQLMQVGTNATLIRRQDAFLNVRGAVGCAESHIAVLRQLRDDGVSAALVLEDDFVWRDPNPVLIQMKLDAAMQDPSWGVCLLAANGVCVPVDEHLQTVVECQTASAYIIRDFYVPKLLALWEEMLPGLKASTRETEGPLCIDQTWKALQRQGRWVATNPLLGKQGESYSDIEQRCVDYGV